MSESEQSKKVKLNDIKPKSTNSGSITSNESSVNQNNRLQIQTYTSYINSINNHPYSNFNVNQIFSNASANYSTSYEYSQVNSYDKLFNCRLNQPTSNAQPNLPIRRKWENTEFGRTWYEMLNQPGKFRKTESEDSKCYNKQHIHQHQRREFTFKLSTYNLLAPNLLEDNMYLYDRINPKYLDWDYRKQKITEQIQNIDSDIWCFQEMEENQYFQYFLPKLTDLGYSCFFKKRIGDKRDGCVICFKTNKFQLVKEERVEYNIPGVEILNRENIAVILLLKTKSRNKSCIKETKDEKYICVATTHLLFNPRRGDCKLAQIQVFLANLDRIAYRKSKWINNRLKTYYHPIIFCGDLNLTNQSPLYQYLAEAKLDNYKEMNYFCLSGQFQISNRDSYTRSIGETILPEKVGITDQSQFKKEIEERLVKTASIKDKETEKTVIYPEYTFGGSSLTHNFNFQSVYEHFTETGAQEVTTITRSSKQIVDYIFYHSMTSSSDEEESDNEKKKDLNDKKEIVHSAPSVDNDIDNKDEKETNSKTPIEASSMSNVTVEAQDLKVAITSSRKRTVNKTDQIRTSSSLKLISRLKLFTNDMISDYCLPNRNYPSDHFMLVAKFVLT